MKFLPEVTSFFVFVIMVLAFTISLDKYLSVNSVEDMKINAIFGVVIGIGILVVRVKVDLRNLQKEVKDLRDNTTENKKVD
jgi:hypothetical protein